MIIIDDEIVNNSNKERAEAIYQIKTELTNAIQSQNQNAKNIIIKKSSNFYYLCISSHPNQQLQKKINKHIYTNKQTNKSTSEITNHINIDFFIHFSKNTLSFVYSFL